MAADEKDETFLARWSRLKRQPEPEKKEEAPPPALPALDKLTPESDFTGFMHPKVEDTLRRVALKKLFSDPHFNLPDPYEAYSGDWTGGEAISQEMLATLNQARTHLFSEEEKAQQPKPDPAAEPAQAQAQAQPQPDEPERKDA